MPYLHGTLHFVLSLAHSSPSSRVLKLSSTAASSLALSQSDEELKVEQSTPEEAESDRHCVSGLS